MYHMPVTLTLHPSACQPFHGYPSLLSRGPQRSYRAILKPRSPNPYHQLQLQIPWFLLISPTELAYHTRLH
eukprot:jgi/Botrbrau1/5292/Bobra.0391s0013.1